MMSTGTEYELRRLDGRKLVWRIKIKKVLGGSSAGSSRPTITRVPVL